MGPYPFRLFHTSLGSTWRTQSQLKSDFQVGDLPSLDTSLHENHAIFAAFLYAYDSHEDIVLSPDDIWLMIYIYFYKYVNDNAEQLRKVFVGHEDKKLLTIVQVGVVETEWVYDIE